MKFDPPIPSIVPMRTGANAEFRFTLEQGAFAGQTYSATLNFCPNECCPCKHLMFVCQPAPEPTGGESPSPAVPPANSQLAFKLDVFERMLDPKVGSYPAEFALACAFVAELQPADWQQWFLVFLQDKQDRMKVMDLDAIEAQFPPKVVEGAATMVSYRTVFPWAEPFLFTLRDAAWTAVDQYCVNPHCDCEEAMLDVVTLPHDAKRPTRPFQPKCVLLQNYLDGHTTVLERKLRSPVATELMAALRAAHPDCDALFQERHRQLRHLARRLIPAGVRDSWRAPPLRSEEAADLPPPPAPPRLPPVRAPAKPGRNDPCPCGSGRKYKRCCGR